MEFVSLITFTDILKLVIREAKIVNDFKPLIKDLASTIERLLPTIEEIELLQESLEPGNKDIIYLTRLMLSAKEMVDKCKSVRPYNLRKIHPYTNQIQKINEDFAKFCQIDLQLIRHRDELRSRSRNDRGKRKQEVDEQILSIAQNTEELSPREAEELQKAIQESLSLRHQQEKQVAQRKDEEQRILNHQQVAKRRNRKVQKRKQIKKAKGSSSMGNEDEEEQRVLLESFKEERKKKQVQKDELIAIAFQESLNAEEPSMRHRRAAKRTAYGSSSSTRALSLDEDEEEQRVLWESSKKRQKKAK